MNTFLTPVFLLSFLASTVFAQGNVVTINSLANVVQCQPSLITWTGGTSPYYLSILPAGQPSASPLLDLGRQDGTSYTWVANLRAGTSGFLQLRDSRGIIGQSGSFLVLDSSDSSCLNSTSVAATSSASTGTGTVSVTGATSAAAGATTAKSSATGTSKTTSATTGAASAKSSTGAAAFHSAPVGTLTMIGAAALALAI